MRATIANFDSATRFDECVKTRQRRFTCTNIFWWLIPLVLLLGIGVATQQSVQAASGTWYRDDGDMMGAKSQAAVNRLNNETFAKVKGHPQLAVITVKSLDDDEIEDYANDQFAKLGIGKRLGQWLASCAFPRRP